MGLRSALFLSVVLPAALAAAEPKPHGTTLRERCEWGHMESCLDLFAPEIPDADLESFCESGDPAGCFELALRRREAKTDDGLELFDKGCTRGFSPACGMEGTFVANADPAKALALFLRSCELGNQHGCAAAGRFNNQGWGVERSVDRARELYRRGCKNGYLVACTNLQNTFLGDDSSPKEQAKALKELERLCNAAEGGACHSVGEWRFSHDSRPSIGEMMFGDKKEAPFDGTAAFKFWDKGCGAGYEGSCQRLRDFGSSKFTDPPAVLSNSTRECDVGRPKACVEAAEVRLGAKGVAPNWREAAKLYQKGCDLGLADACVKVGELRVKRGQLPQEERRKVLVGACDRGVLPACARLGEWMAEGTWGPRDEGTALSLFTRACTSEQGAGCEGAATILRGQGRAAEAVEALEKGCRSTQASLCTKAAGAVLEADPSRARALWRLGCASGDSKSCKELERRKLAIGAVRSHRPLPELMLGGQRPLYVGFEPSGERVVVQGSVNPNVLEWRSSSTWQVVGSVGLPVRRGTVEALSFDGPAPVALLDTYSEGPKLWRFGDEAARPLAKESGKLCRGGVFADGGERVFVPAGEHMCGGSSVQAYDVASGMPVGSPIPLPGIIFQLRSSLDGAEILATTYGGGLARVRPSDGTAEVIRAPKEGSSSSAKVVPLEAGGLAAMLSEATSDYVQIYRDGTSARGWSMDLNIHVAERDPSGRWLAIGTDQGLAILSASDGNLAHPFVPMGDVQLLAFSPSGDRLVVVMKTSVRLVELREP